MAACIVCNCPAMAGDLPDLGDMVNLCARLEKVLGEAVPVVSVMCSSCQFDLSQIEMYYALLTEFKMRYSETAKLRLHSLPADTSRNLLHEAAGSSSSNLQSILVASDNSNTGSRLHSHDSGDKVRSETYSPVGKLKILAVRKDEFHVGDSVPLDDLPMGFKEEPSMVSGSEVHDWSANTSGQPYFAPGEAEIRETFSDDSVEATAWEADVAKKRGRPRKMQQSGAILSPGGVVKKDQSSKMEQSNVVSSLGMVGILRKRGRPRKNEQPTGSPLYGSTRSGKLVRARKDASDSSTAYAKERGQPRKYSSESKNKGLKIDSVTKEKTPIDFEEFSHGGQSTNESDVDDPSYDPKQSSSTSKCSRRRVVHEPMENKTGDSIIEGSNADTSSRATDPTAEDAFIIGGAVTKNKRGRPRKIKDPSNIVAVIQKKRGRSKKADGGRHSASPCNICDKVFSTPGKLKQHMKSHTEDRAFGCSICNKGFKSIGDLNAHKKIHTSDRPFKCPMCGKGFLWKHTRDRHLVVHNEVQAFQCEQCDRKFKGEGHLKHHVKVHHMDGRKYLCNICGLALLTEGSLKIHLKTHNDARPFTCETCGRGFSTKASLLNHEPTHNADTREKYLCPVCGKEFLQKSYLPLHMRQHTGESKYICSICNKSFLTSTCYKNHMIIHSGEKPHRCSECGKGFAAKANLKTHMMSHTDERPFKCSCGQSFRSRAKMRRHMRTIKHGEYSEKSVAIESLNRPVQPATSAAASVPAASPCLTVERMSMPAPLLLVPPLPIVPPLAIADQHEMATRWFPST